MSEATDLSLGRQFVPTGSALKTLYFLPVSRRKAPSYISLLISGVMTQRLLASSSDLDTDLHTSCPQSRA